MKSVVTDRAALESMMPGTVEAYLRANGWQEVNRTEGLASVWCSPDNKSRRGFDLLVPLDPELGDYAERMADLFLKLETFEQRSANSIYQALREQGVDRMEVQLDRADAADGSIPLLSGARAFRGVRDMLAAAAASELAPRSLHPSQLAPEARQALRHARLGQTGSGSYIITVLSHLPEQAPARPSTPHATEPMERRIFRRTAIALEAARHAAERGSEEAFEDGVTYGISANLCSALVRLGEGKRLRAVRISMGWGSVYPVPEGTPRQIVFQPRHFLVIRRAAQHLKQARPRPEFVLQGRVIQLRKTEDMPEGSVIVHGRVDTQEREVAMSLTPAHYRLAVEAHGAGLGVRCEGELLVRGGTYKLLGVTRFTVPQRGS